MSETRKRYTVRLICRCVILIICLIASFKAPRLFRALDGNAFFDRFTLLHLLWIVWVIDMIQQIIPIKNKVALGSQKLFLNRFKPIRDRIVRFLLSLPLRIIKVPSEESVFLSFLLFSMSVTWFVFWSGALSAWWWIRAAVQPAESSIGTILWCFPRWRLWAVFLHFPYL